MPSDRAMLRRLPRLVLILTLVLVAFLLLCCPDARPWMWDSREYPHADGFFHISKGNDDLEEDLLPFYGVDLPCGVTGLRYGNLEEPVSQLYLRFTAPATCLERFRTIYDLAPASASPGSPFIPDAYEWRISKAAEVYRGEFDGNYLTLFLEGSSTPQLAYLVIERWGPPRQVAVR